MTTSTATIHEFPIPDSDTEFQEFTISEVKKIAGGFSITLGESKPWAVRFPEGVVPKVGDTARVYGKGPEYAIRGLTLNGRKIFYRTATDQQIWSDEVRFGKDSAEWLERWDAGEVVYSISSGNNNLYLEYKTQVLLAETLRFFLDTGVDFSSEDLDAVGLTTKVQDFYENSAVVRKLGGTSGSMQYAAQTYAALIHGMGPAKAFNSVKDTDALIQVKRSFVDPYQ